jgi:hypothetical protein
MRSTKATAALQRLKTRSSNSQYSMVRTADGLFYLVLNSGSGTPEKLSGPLEQDDFVKFVDSLGPQKPKKVSKLDAAFEKQLNRKQPSHKKGEL